QRRRVGELACLHALAQAVHELRGGGDADVAGEQGGLDLVQQRFVELRVAREQAAHAAREGAAARARAPAAGTSRGRGGLAIGRGGRGGGRRRGRGRGRIRGGRRRFRLLAAEETHHRGDHRAEWRAW